MAVPACLALSSCYCEPDDSNLYTFTGETVEDFLVNNEEQFSSFNYILTRVGYDRILSSYGTYTCFAPVNDAVQEYIDSLYDDKENLDLPHNGMTERSLEGLTDSLCLDIALFHLMGKKVLTTDMSATGSMLTTLLGRKLTTSIADGKNVLNDAAAITMADREVVNGVVHVVDHVIPRSNRYVVDELKKAGKFSIFYEALMMTGLADSLKETEKNKVFTTPKTEDGYYTPTTCKKGYTIFAETDDVFRSHGINTVADLIDSAAVWYGKAALSPKRSGQGWYDYYRNNGVRVSTADDYTSAANALNMFVRYHILNYGVSKINIAPTYGIWTHNGYSGDSYDYFETMLPKTLMKAWRLRRTNKVYINRYVTNNTLTDGIETMGSDAMHRLVFGGVELKTDSMMSPLNGYVYPIGDVLVYNSQVPDGVLHERMRFDIFTFLHESMSNGFRGATMSEMVVLNNNKAANRIRYPVDYFDNIRVYNGNNTTLDMCVRADPGAKNYLLYFGDSFQGLGVYDFAVKLPPVPDGMYELRTTFSVMKHGSMLQYYIGRSSDIDDMEPIGIPLDMRMDPSQDDPRVQEIGYCDILDQERNPEAFADRGFASDKVMRTHGYMRETLISYREDRNVEAYVARFRCGLRRILVKRDFEQGDYWLRLKTVLPDVTNGKFQIDYIEFVPVSVSENDRYVEDMY